MARSNIGIVIQARMGSSRLPGKVLMDFCGKPLLLFQIALLRKYNLPAELIVATTTNSVDDQIEAFCKTHNISCLRGDDHNVFLRYSQVARLFHLEHIIRLTGDNPLTNYRTLTMCVRQHLQCLPDLTTTRKIRADKSIERYAPKGNSVDVIKCATMLTIDPHSLTDFEKEHVIPIFFNGPYRVSYVKDTRPQTISLSVDNISDFERVSRYVTNCMEEGVLLRELCFQGEEELIEGT